MYTSRKSTLKVAGKKVHCQISHLTAERKVKVN